MSRHASAMTVPTAQECSLTDREFDLFRKLVYERTGIALGPHKRPLLHARLGRRLRALGLTSFGDYYDYLMDPGSGPAEITRFVNAITTNKTDFFREPHHFTHLGGPWAEARRQAALRGVRRLRLWSAACSTGEEPYTLAMVLLEAGFRGPAWDLRILASDIDTDALGHADAGIYGLDRIAPVPADLRRRYFRGDAGDAGDVQVTRELRDVIAFRRINLAEPAWPIRTVFDAILCRNALIYFDRDMQRAILTRLIAHLAPGGLLFLGHAESVFGLVEGLTHLGNTIYARAGEGRGGAA